MLVSQAHSFQRQARLAVTLAWIAGYTNIVALLTCGWAVSHVTGTVSQWGLDVVTGRWGLVGFTSLVLGTFFLGAVAAAACIELGRRRGWESIYILPIAVEATLLAGFAVGVSQHEVGTTEQGGRLWLMISCASMAMGLQNATITRLSGGVIRTTHMTGVLTDLGQDLVTVLATRGATRGDASRIRPWGTPAGRHLLLLLAVLGSFALGAGLGAVVYGQPRAAAWSMVLPVLFLLWIIWQDSHTPICAIEETSLTRGDDGLRLPESMAVFHLRRPRRAGRPIHRLPDLVRWFEALPGSRRVVILDMTEATSLDDNALLDLLALVRLAKGQGRWITIAGLTPTHYTRLANLGGATIGPEVISPDLDLAIAMGVAVAGSNIAT